jgi:hypothetical protein
LPLAMNMRMRRASRLSLTADAGAAAFACEAGALPLVVLSASGPPDCC